MSAIEEGIALDGTVIVTGGGAGIGRATALLCAERGAAVAVLDVDQEAARKVAVEATDHGGGGAIGIGCDVRDESAVAAAVTTARTLGPVRGMVACAGIGPGGLAHEMPTEVWREVIDTNLTGTFLSCKHALAAMLVDGEGGSIVCASSPWAEASAPEAFAYSASKGGISALVRGLALDYAASGIRINAIVPGATETALMWGDMPAEEIPAARERIAGQLAIGRLAAPAEIAAGIAWLLSGQASYVTGSQMVVDGGLMARASIES